MHFSFSVGALLAPLVARPFLREDHGLLEQSGPIIEKFTFWQIRWLYPLVGLATVVLSPGYLAYYLGEKQHKADTGLTEDSVVTGKLRYLMVAIMAGFYF